MRERSVESAWLHALLWTGATTGGCLLGLGVHSMAELPRLYVVFTLSGTIYLCQLGVVWWLPPRREAVIPWRAIRWLPGLLLLPWILMLVVVIGDAIVDAIRILLFPPPTPVYFTTHCGSPFRPVSASAAITGLLLGLFPFGRVNTRRVLWWWLLSTSAYLTAAVGAFRLVQLVFRGLVSAGLLAPHMVWGVPYDLAQVLVIGLTAGSATSLAVSLGGAWTAGSEDGELGPEAMFGDRSNLRHDA